MINSYSKRFTISYLNELRQQHLYQKLKDSSNNLLIGDIVLICDDAHMSRNQWQLEKVDEVGVGKDGQIQQAKLM